MKSILDKFNNAIEQFVKKDEKLVLAVSGGSDSMCMLNLALSSALINRDDILVVTVEHGIRGKESKSDAEFVREFCENNNIKFKQFSVDVPKLAQEKKLSIESAARQARQEIFKGLIGEYGKVLTAHNKDDNVESILMHIFRGCGLDGLKGMDYLTDGYLLRPLMDASKEEITEFLASNKIQFVDDSTNSDSKYTRNFIRNEVLPLIKSRYNGVNNAVINLSDDAKKVLKDTDESGITCGTNLVKIALDKLGATEYSRKNICDIAALKDKNNGTGIDIVGNIRAEKDENYITIFKKGKCRGEHHSPAALYFDIAKIPPTAVFRNRRDGDIFKPCNGRTKKLKQYLIDKKIPSRERDDLILLCDGGEVLAILGVEISDKIKCGTSNKK